MNSPNWPLPASRTAAVNPFRVMSVMERAGQLSLQGRHIVHLEVGEPDFATASPIIEAGKQALDAGRTAYTPAPGLPALRRRIAQWYAQRHQVEVDPARIFVTPGASGALHLLAQLLINPGDGVLMSDPGYPCNRNYVELAGGRTQLVPLSADTGWQLTPEQLEALRDDHTRGVWLASPSNPTGAAMSREALVALSDWAQAHRLYLLVDEIYHGLDFTGGLPSALEVNPGAIVVNSFSKYFGMTGWRLGWFIVPEHLIEVCNTLAQNLFIAAPTVSQYAALRAMDDDLVVEHERRREIFRQRRDFLTPALREIGFDIPLDADGAFYLYAGIGRFSDDSESFCHRLLEEHGVALTPGTDFGLHRAREHVRLAFTTDQKSLALAVERLRRALA